MWNKLNINDKMNLMKSYRKGGFSYNDMIEDYNNSYNKYREGGMLKRADGSYSERGLWDNIRDNAGSGKAPTSEMLKQEKKIKNKYQDGGEVELPKKDMYGNPITMSAEYSNTNRAYYDPRANTAYLDENVKNMSKDEFDRTIAHENRHAWQLDNDRTNFDITHNTEGADYARMLKKPSMMSTDEVWNNYHDRKTREVNKDIGDFVNKNKSFQFVPGDLIYDRAVDNQQYSNPNSKEGEASLYEWTGKTPEQYSKHKYGGTINQYEDGGVHEKPSMQLPNQYYNPSETVNKQLIINPYQRAQQINKSNYIPTLTIEQQKEKAKKDYINQYVKEGVKKVSDFAPFKAAAYLTPAGMAVGAIEGAANIGPDLYNKEYLSAAGDALMMAPGINEAGKYIKNSSIKNKVLGKLYNSNLIKNSPDIKDHLLGLYKGINDDRPFFEKFPITKAQKELAYTKQDEAFKEGNRFLDNYYYGKGIKMRPEIENKIKYIDPPISTPLFIPAKGNILMDDKLSNINAFNKENPLITRKNKLISTRSNDLINSNLSDESKAYLLNNRGNIAGVNISRNNESITLRNHGFYNINPNEIKHTAIHEGTHSAQKFKTNKYLPYSSNITRPPSNENKYWFPNKNTEIGKEFSEAMVEPVKGKSTWEASPDELHSELMPARERLYKTYINQGVSKEDAMNSILNPSDEIIDYMIADGKLNRFFKESTSQETKRKLIKILPAFIPAVAVAEKVINKENIPWRNNENK